MSTHASLSPRLRLTQAIMGAVATGARSLFPFASPPARPAGAEPQRQRILVVRLDELGDMVLFSGFFSALRRHYPHADITLVAKRAGAEIMAASPYVTRVIAFEPNVPAGLRPVLMPFLARRFIARAPGHGGFDVAIQPRWDIDSMYAGWLAYFSGAPLRVGFSERVTQGKQVFNRGLDQLYTHTVDVRGPAHESERAGDILHALGLGRELGPPEVWPAGACSDEIDATLGEVTGDGRPLVAIGPSGGHSALKAWPVERFAAVARELARRHGAAVVILGAPSDRELGDELARRAGVPVTNLVGRTSLAEMVAVLDRSALYVGNDTGLLHVAVARGIPTVSMYGPSPASLFGPRGSSHRVIWSRLPCGPPFPEDTDLPNARAHGLPAVRCVSCLYSRVQCMDAITTDAVLKECIAALLDSTGCTDMPGHRPDTALSSGH